MYRDCSPHKGFQVVACYDFQATLTVLIRGIPMEKIKAFLSRGASTIAIPLTSAVFLLLKCGNYCAAPCQAEANSSLTVESKSFKNNSLIPSRFTADGANISPSLHWSKAAAATKSYCLICNDPDAPNGNWVHWVAYDIPSNVDSIIENASSAGQFARQGVNSFNKVGWNGPAPPAGKAHRYIFTVYALNTTLGNIGKPTDADLKKRAAGHILSSGAIVGLYKR
jgi:Raf kinase inhibitor-like YbhB/YbcL family protein